MPASTARYFGFNLIASAFQRNVAGTVTDAPLLYANKVSIKPEEENITFEGDGQKKILYILTALTLEFSPDVLNIAAASSMFAKTEIVTGLPAAYAAGTWFGDTVEAAGVAAGFWAEGSAVKDVAGVQSSKTIRLWVPLGTLTLSTPGDIETTKKWGQQVWRLSSTRTSVDVGGNALPTVPSGGAHYIIMEK